MSGQTVNHREVIAGLSTVTNKPEYLKSTNGFLDVAVTVSPAELPGVVVSGQQTVTGTAQPLPATALTQGVILTAISTNLVSIFVGGPGVTPTTGDELTPGSKDGVAVNDTSDIFIVCVSGSPVVSWIGS